MLVSGRSAAATFATSVTSTRLTATPRSPSVPYRLLVLPNTKRLETRWSPALSSVKNSAVMAAMPVEKQMAPMPWSIFASLASSAAVVGVPWRA